MRIHLDEHSSYTCTLLNNLENPTVKDCLDSIDTRKTYILCVNAELSGDDENQAWADEALKVIDILTTWLEMYELSTPLDVKSDGVWFTMNSKGEVK